MMFDQAEQLDIFRIEENRKRDIIKNYIHIAKRNYVSIDRAANRALASQGDDKLYWPAVNHDSRISALDAVLTSFDENFPYSKRQTLKVCTVRTAPSRHGGNSERDSADF